MTDDLPLPTLLSQLLIAFTIEFDNEAEHRLCSTALSRSPAGPRLVAQLTPEGSPGGRILTRAAGPGRPAGISLLTGSSGIAV